MFSVKKAAVAAAVVTVVGGLGACSAHPGAAVIVNGVAYSEADITEGVEQYAELTGNRLERPTFANAIPGVVNQIDLARELGLDISDEAVDAYVQTLVDAGRIVAPEEELGTVMRDIFRQTIAVSQFNELGASAAPAISEAYEQILANQSVVINPRYGTVDPTTGANLLPLFADVVDSASLSAAEGE